MSIWSGVGLAATLMHATSSIYNSASSEESKHNNTWHMDPDLFIEPRTANIPLLGFKCSYDTNEVYLLVEPSCRHLPNLSGELGTRDVRPMPIFEVCISM